MKVLFNFRLAQLRVMKKMERLNEIFIIDSIRYNNKPTQIKLLTA